MKLIAAVLCSTAGALLKSELELKAMKNIFITLDYNKKDDPTRDKIKYKDLEKIGWYGIYAQNLFDAERQLMLYLGKEYADNIILLSHGGAAGRIQFVSDNNFDIRIGSDDLKDMIDDPSALFHTDTTTYVEIDHLKVIVSHVVQEGNFILASCNSAINDSFLGNLQLLTGSRVNMYGIEYSSMVAFLPYRNEKRELVGDTKYISADDLLNYSFIEKNLDEEDEGYGELIGGARLFPKGWKIGDNSVFITDIGVAYNGICITE